MLKQLHCSRGHFWEANGTEEAPDVRAVFCPVCGDIADSVPLLDLATSAAPGDGAVPVDDGGPLQDPSGRPVVAGYENLADLGKTAAGVLRYRARNHLLNRVVQLEVVLAKDDPGQQAWGALRGSANALARLPHPHIVTLLEAGERDRQLFYNVVERIEGPTLADLLDGEPWSLREAAALVELLARTLDFAHRQGAVHRCLKPASILLEPRPEKSPPPAPIEAGWLRLRGKWYRPRITDFGLHRRPTEGEPADLALQGERPCWLSPEQAWGQTKEIGPATDVYGLGAILYELLTGQPPFRAETAMQTLDQVMVFDLKPPEIVRPALAPDLGAICRKATSKRPDKRYATPGDMAEDLRRFQAGNAVEARPLTGPEAAGRWCRRHARLLLVVLLLIAGWIVPGMVRGPGAGPSPREEQASREQAGNDSFQRHRAWLEANEAQERLVATDLRARALHVQREELAGNVTRAQELLQDFPGGQRGWVRAFLRDHLPGGRGPILQAKNLPYLVQGLAFRPDGQELAIALGAEKGAPRGGEVRIWNVRAQRETFALRDFAEPVRKVAWHPDSDLLAVVSGRLDLNQSGELRIWQRSRNLDRCRRAAGTAPPSSVAYSETGTALMVADREGIVEIAEPRTGELFRRLSSFNEIPGPRGRRGVSLRAVFYDVQGDSVAVISPNGHTIHTLGSDGNQRGRLDPQQGELLALALDENCHFRATAGRDRTVHLQNLQWQEDPHLLRGFDGTVLDLVFSPDARLLATVETEGKVRVWDVKLAQEILSFAGPAGPNPCLAFSKDGRMLAVGNGNEVTVWGEP
jgi:serine/threonine-protein kinase